LKNVRFFFFDETKKTEGSFTVFCFLGKISQAKVFLPREFLSLSILFLNTLTGEIFYMIMKIIELYFMVTISSYIVLLIGALGFTLTLYLGFLKGIKLI